MNQKDKLSNSIKTRALLLFLIITGFATQVKSQIIMSSYFGKEAAVDNYEEAQAGVTTNSYLTVQYNMIAGANYAPGWTVKVRANGNFTNGTHSIPSQYVSLKFRDSKQGLPGVTGTEVPLTTTDANLITTTQPLNTPPTYYMAQDYDLMIQGGNHLMLPQTGIYSSTVTLSFYTNAGQLIATTIVPISFSVNFSTGCSGMVITASSNINYNFDTYAKLLSGGTATNALNVQYNPNGANCTGWTLKIRANGNFTNGSSAISPEHVAIRFNNVSQGKPTAAAIGVTNNLVPLSASDVILINPSNAAFNNYTSHAFDMVIQGGNYLLLGNSGTYSCPVTLSLYNQAGQLVSSSNTKLSFQITFANNSNYTISLLNPDVSMLYQTPADYLTGKTVTKIKGLKVVGTKAYQVIVKTLHPHLISGSSTIPVEVVRLENTPPAGKSGITSFPINLSSTDQLIIKNMMSDNTYRTIEYDLKYSISGSNTTISSAASGSYTTQVIFVVLPL
ncbi:hypothetical protein [Pedobacter immunditicola]|uniref:hypothetical protein n=1 Tax=Pedobacter immunditicola TaxID=3133440 RepID=UPI003097A327